MRHPMILRAARLAGMPTSDALLPLVPLVQAGVLAEVDVYVAAVLAARFDEADGQVLLAAALAHRAPRAGHTAVDLATVDSEGLTASLRGQEPLDDEALPASRDAWRDAVAGSALVRAAGEGGTVPLVLRGSLLYTDRYFRYEDRLYDALVARFEQERPVGDAALLAQGLDALFPTPAGTVDRQRQAAEQALHRGLTVISGGPGTGKTWTVRNLLTLLYAQCMAADGVPPRLALAAPTGKAAARVAESLRNGLEGHLQRAAAALPPGVGPEGLGAFLEAAQPATLHRLLGWRPDAPTRFRHDADDPLPVDVLIVDEASMVDLAMMSRLFDAVPASARVVLLGDRHQLASVEAGTVLADLCGGEEGQPVAEGVVFLTKSRRFAAGSGIGQVAAAAVEGRIDDALAGMPTWGDGAPGPLPAQGEPERSIGRFASAGGHAWSEAVLVHAVEGYRPYLERLRRGRVDGESLEAVHRSALARFDGFRVLCAHRRHRFGVQGANEAVQERLARAGLVQPRGPWWLGRPVLVTRNDYGVGRFNGDIGLVVRDAEGQWVVAFPGDEGVVYLPPARLPEHQTVFAMTIHKSQGSEFDDVLVVLPSEPSPVLSRELVYTGITRARRRVSVYGPRAVLAHGLGRRVQRASGLGRAFASTAPLT